MARHRLFDAKRDGKWHLLIRPDGSRFYIGTLQIQNITYRDGYSYIQL